MSEERFTLDEARRQLAQMQCDQMGHHYQHVTSPGQPGQLVSVLCSSCGASWTVDYQGRP